MTDRHEDALAARLDEIQADLKRLLARSGGANVDLVRALTTGQVAVVEGSGAAVAGQGSLALGTRAIQINGDVGEQATDVARCLICNRYRLDG